MYGGIVNDNIVFPVLDLIRREIRDRGYDFGIPNVKLYRDHPEDDEIVTSAKLTYESGLIERIQLTRGSEDESTYPEGLKPRHPDYEYCRFWRLTQVGIIYLSKDEEVIDNYLISLFYDKRGLLDNTVVSKI